MKKIAFLLYFSFLSYGMDKFALPSNHIIVTEDTLSFLPGQIGREIKAKSFSYDLICNDLINRVFDPKDFVEDKKFDPIVENFEKLLDKKTPVDESNKIRTFLNKNKILVRHKNTLANNPKNHNQANKKKNSLTELKLLLLNKNFKNFFNQAAEEKLTDDNLSDLFDILVFYKNLEDINQFFSTFSINFSALVKKPIIFSAIKTNDEKIVELILKQNPDLSVKQEGKTALEFCLNDNKISDKVNKLIIQKSDVNQIFSYGNLPLQVAFYCSKYSLVSAIATKTNMNAYNTKGFTPFHSVLFETKRLDLKKRKELINIFIKKYKGDIDNPVKNNSTQATPLAYAINQKDAELTKFLLELNAFYFFAGIPYGFFTCPLYMAAQFLGSDVLEIIVAKYGKKYINKLQFGKTPLHCAVAGKNYEAVKWLIEHGADVNQKDEAGLTPIELALITKNLKVKDYFIELLDDEDEK